MFIPLFNAAHCGTVYEQFEHKKTSELKKIIESNSLDTDNLFEDIKDYFDSDKRVEYYAAMMVLENRGCNIPADNSF